MVLLPLAVILTSQLAAAPAPAPSRPSLVAAEYAFAERTAKDGIRAGFMGAMRPDATIFIPRPVNGPTYYKTQLELGALLSWRPAVAEASQAGDLGYCSGPYTFQVAKDAPVAAYGWFVTVWQREGKEPWKLRLEIGIPTPDPAGRPEVQFLPRAEAQPPALEGAATGNPA
jgi:hypothetical protein